MSEILVDNLTGKTSAGSVTVTSEGGAATQSLQQGLAKGWYHLDNDYTGTNPSGGNVTVQDSFNIASITDNGTGDYTMAWTNSFDNALYAITQQGQYRDDETQHEYAFQCGVKGSPTSSQYTFTWRYYTSSAYDPSKWWAVSHGDLA